ncbi:MAG: hypothetical protein PUF12_06170 [Thermoflexaceae bacterium]|nr:hypothetical protein [Thermoflexaceae bacterium]
MEEQFYNTENQNTRPSLYRDKVALVALIAGVIAIPMSMFIIPGILFGIAAITLGIISRINFEKFHLQNVLGITFGGIAIFLSGIMFLGTVLLLRDPETMAQLKEIMEMYYGY